MRANIPNADERKKPQTKHINTAPINILIRFINVALDTLIVGWFSVHRLLHHTNTPLSLICHSIFVSTFNDLIINVSKNVHSTRSFISWFLALFVLSQQVTDEKRHWNERIKCCDSMHDLLIYFGLFLTFIHILQRSLWNIQLKMNILICWTPVHRYYCNFVARSFQRDRKFGINWNISSTLSIRSIWFSFTKKWFVRFHLAMMFLHVFQRSNVLQCKSSFTAMFLVRNDYSVLCGHFI